MTGDAIHRTWHLLCAQHSAALCPVTKHLVHIRSSGSAPSWCPYPQKPTSTISHSNPTQSFRSSDVIGAPPTVLQTLVIMSVTPPPILDLVVEKQTFLHKDPPWPVGPLSVTISEFSWYLFSPCFQNLLMYYTWPHLSHTLCLVLRNQFGLSNLAFSKVRNMDFSHPHGRHLWFTHFIENCWKSWRPRMKFSMHLKYMQGPGFNFMHHKDFKISE